MNVYVYGNLCCYRYTYTHYLFILYLVKQVARVRVRVLSNCYIFIWAHKHVVTKYMTTLISKTLYSAQLKAKHDIFI